jgi:hypothetical protein
MLTTTNLSQAMLTSRCILFRKTAKSLHSELFIIPYLEAGIIAPNVSTFHLQRNPSVKSGVYPLLAVRLADLDLGIRRLKGEDAFLGKIALY